MAQLMHQRLVPAMIGHQVIERAHVTFAVNVGAEGMLILALAGIEIGARQDITHVHAQTIIRCQR